MSKINEVAELVEKGKAKLVGPAVQEAIDEGDDPVAILNDGMISAMSVVGDKFKNGEIFVPEMLVAARAMKKGVEVLKPHLASGSTGALGKVIIATVSGDLHDIGKNLVAMMIESAGFEVIDLGVDVPAAKIIECYKENPDVKIIALSALLTTTMPALKETVEALNSEAILRLWLAGHRLPRRLLRRLGLMVILMMRPVQLHWLRSWLRLKRNLNLNLVITGISIT